MNQNYWLIILFVAAMVCNEVKSRPQDVDLTNVHSPHKTVQTEPEAPNRYEKYFRKFEVEGVTKTYTRIDIPYTPKIKLLNKSKPGDRIQIKNMPLAVAIKKTNLKRWPSDQNGIETSDDLSLYNNYINNVRPLIVEPPSLTHENQISSKPSILVLEELVPEKPQINNSNNDFSEALNHVPLYKPPEYSVPSLTVHVEASLESNPAMPQNTPLLPLSIHTSRPRPVHVYGNAEEVTKRPVHSSPSISAIFTSRPRPKPIYVYNDPAVDVIEHPTSQHTFRPVESSLHNQYMPNSPKPPNHGSNSYQDLSDSNANERPQYHHTSPPTIVKPETTTKRQSKPGCIKGSGFNNKKKGNKAGCQGANVAAGIQTNPEIFSTVAIQDNLEYFQTGFYTFFNAILNTLRRFLNFFFKLVC